MTKAVRGWIFDGTAPAAVMLVRVVVSVVFISEGIQKFLFPGELGVGRFAKIGIPAPEVMAPFVGVLEIVGGSCLLLGLATRVVCIPLFVQMLVAITSTKAAMLAKAGIWKTLHEARTDLLMLFCLAFLFAVGAGRESLDARLARAPRSR